MVAWILDFFQFFSSDLFLFHPRHFLCVLGLRAHVTKQSTAAMTSYVMFSYDFLAHLAIAN